MILPVWPPSDERARQTSPMCGRYTLKSRAEIIAETCGVQVPPTLPERAYFSIGDREKNSKNPRLACVETRTQAAHQLMQARGASSILELNPGGHFEHVPARMARAVEWLLA